MLSYGLRPLQEREAITREAERLSKATEANTKAADDLRMRWVAIKDSLEAIGVALLEKITPVMERLLPVIEKMELRFAAWIGDMNSDAPVNFFTRITDSVDGLLVKLRELKEYWDATKQALNDVGEELGGSLFESTHGGQGAGVSLMNPGGGGAGVDATWGRLLESNQARLCAAAVSRGFSSRDREVPPAAGPTRTNRGPRVQGLIRMRWARPENSASCSCGRSITRTRGATPPLTFSKPRKL